MSAINLEGLYDNNSYMLMNIHSHIKLMPLFVLLHMIMLTADVCKHCRLAGCQILIILIDIWVSIELFGDRLLFGCCIKRDGTQKHAKIHFSLIIARFCIQFYSPAPVLNLISQWENFFVHGRRPPMVFNTFKVSN